MALPKNVTGYRFLEKDPVIDLYREAKRISGMTPREIYEAGGATVATQRTWDYGDVRRPQHLTLRFTMAAMDFREQFANSAGTVLKSDYKKSAAAPPKKPRKKGRTK